MDSDDLDLEIIGGARELATEPAQTPILELLKAIDDFPIENRTSRSMHLDSLRALPSDEHLRSILATCGNFIRYELALEAIHTASVKVLKDIFEDLDQFKEGIPLAQMAEWVCGELMKCIHMCDSLLRRLP